MSNSEDPDCKMTCVPSCRTINSVLKQVGAKVPAKALQADELKLLSIVWEGNVWYEAGYASTARAKCKEFRCGEFFKPGELRIGICQDENDNCGTNLGWYHPNCLWRTFSYRKNANKRITKPDEIKGFRDVLTAEDQEVFFNLISGKVNPYRQKRQEEEVGSGSKVLPAGVSYKYDLKNNVLGIGGNSFSIKDDLKSLGGKWSPEDKCWNFAGEMAVHCVLRHFDLTEKNLEGGQGWLKRT